jgi:ribonuclease J
LSAAKKPLGELKILPLGGLGEIGMNCMILEYDDEILVVDCGLLFSDLDHFGVEFVIPDFSYLLERKDKVKGFLITHGHEDHIGSLAFAIKAGIRAPIFASRFSSMLINKRLEEYGLKDRVDLRTFKMGDQIKFKHFTATTVSVNHSIIDAAALIIDTPVGKIIHTGDFKMDPTPFFGRMIDLDIFKKAGDEGVLLLMSDSTNVERHEHSMSESVIYQSFEHLFAATEGLTIVSMFASNVGRMGQVLDIARKLGKKVALSGRTMESNARFAAELGYFRDLDNLVITMNDIDKYRRNEVIVLSTGSQGEHRSSLIRMANGEHGQIQLQQGDVVLMSSKFIPGNEKAIGQMINALFRQGAEVLYEAIHDIHVSGHATRPELKQMIELTRPKFFIPIHGEYRHLVHHAALAKETGLPPENVLIVNNGDLVEVTAESCEVVEQFGEGRVLVEGREGSDISKHVLKDRRHIAEKGIVFALLVRNSDTRRIMSVPEVISRGLTGDEMEPHLMEEGRTVVQKVVRRYEEEIRVGNHNMDLQENIRVELRRFFNQNLGKKPVVLPIILDL